MDAKIILVAQRSTSPSLGVGRVAKRQFPGGNDFKES